MEEEDLELSKRHIRKLLDILVTIQNTLAPFQRNSMREAGAFLSDDPTRLPQYGNNPRGFDWKGKD